MMNFPLVIVITIAVFLFSSAAIAALIAIYARKGHLDAPNHRSMHTKATPTGAGIVIAIVMVASFVVSYCVWPEKRLLYGTGITGLLAVIGWWDDKRFMSAKTRLTLFFLLATVLVTMVGQVDEINFRSDNIVQIPIIIAAVLTVIGFVWVVNLYNFMDGMDGLAGIQTIIAAAFFSHWFFHSGDEVLTIVNLLIVATSLGFLVFNWFPAKIFMGDVGSLPIGGFFATMTVIGVSQYNFSVIACALLIGVFVFDATYTFLRRLIKGEAVFEAHCSHLYQRLASCNISHRLIVLVNGIFMLLLASFAEAARLNVLSSLQAGVIGLISVLSLVAWVILAEKFYKPTYNHVSKANK